MSPYVVQLRILQHYAFLFIRKGFQNFHMLPESSGIGETQHDRLEHLQSYRELLHSPATRERFFYIATCSLFLQDQSDCRIMPDSRCRLTVFDSRIVYCARV